MAQNRTGQTPQANRSQQEQDDMKRNVPSTNQPNKSGDTDKDLRTKQDKDLGKGKDKTTKQNH